MNGLRTAAAFLTRVPVGRTETDEAALARSIPWFPAVGALVGLAVAGLYAAGSLVLPPFAAAAIAVLGGVGLTGAFHEDGLADCADALGGWTPEEARRILRDPAHGTYGVLALVGSVLVRVVALGALPVLVSLAVVPAAHALGRGGALVTMSLSRTSVDGTGLGAAYTARATRAGLLVGMLSAVALGSPAGLALLFVIVCAVAGAAGVAWARRKLGGITGDVLGAVEQLGEIGVLAGAAAFVHSGIDLAPWLA